MADTGKGKLKVVIMTVDRTVFEAEADSVTGLGIHGEFTILPNHIAFMTPLDIGILTTRGTKGEESVALHAGFLRVEDNTVTVLADAAEQAEDIDIARAKAAKQRAEELLKRLGEGGAGLESASASLRRALMRLRVADRN